MPKVKRKKNLKRRVRVDGKNKVVVKKKYFYRERESNREGDRKRKKQETKRKSFRFIRHGRSGRRN